MKQLPIALRFILNILFFVIYCVILQFLSGFILWWTYKSLWKAIPYSWDPIFIKIALVTFLFILIFTLIFRKYFYISLDLNKDVEEDEKNYNNKEKQEKLNNNKEKNLNKDSEHMKIYIEKEINK